MKSILVMPQYNEEKTVVSVLTRAAKYVDAMIVVNDGSTDNSRNLISYWMESNGKLHLLSLPENRGVSGALLAGFHWVRELLKCGSLQPDDIIINIDADGQHIPEEIPKARDYMISNKLDILLTNRDFSGYPTYKRIGNWGLSLSATILSGFKYNDVECGFRLMRAGVISQMLEYFTGRRYGCCQEIGIITALLGYKIDNSFYSPIAYYRPGARLRDGFTNLTMGILAALRVRLGIRNNLDEVSRRILRNVDIDGLNHGDECALSAMTSLAVGE